MSSKKPRLEVTKEEKTGMNKEFKDTKTGETLTRSEVAKRIDQGKYDDYHHYRDDNNRLVIRSNPNDNESDNLG